MADETNTIEQLIVDMRRRLKKTPRVLPVFESLLEHLEHVYVPEAEHEQALDRLLAEVVVDAVDGFFIEGSPERAVERLR